MLTGTLVEDRDTGVWTATLVGSLTMSDTAMVVSVVRKCFGQCPAAIVVDLRGLTEVNDTALSILPTLQRSAAIVEVPLVYVGRPELGERVRRGPARRFLRIHPTLRDGQESAGQAPGRRWLRLRLPPQPLTTGTARTAVGDACRDWGLPQILHPARMIVNELVDNAVHHARTDVEVTTGVLAEYLHIRVRDGSAMLPVRRSAEPRRSEAPLDLVGRGLRVLDQRASAWGTIRQPDGKVVWASLRLSASGVAT